MKGGVTGNEFSTSARSSIHNDDRYLSMEYVFSHHPQVFLVTQYMILRVALHQVLIVIALGHVHANVKSFEKKNKNNFKNNNKR